VFSLSGLDFQYKRDERKVEPLRQSSTKEASSGPLRPEKEVTSAPDYPIRPVYGVAKAAKVATQAFPMHLKRRDNGEQPIGIGGRMKAEEEA
jgi:hypothetical protein